MSVLIRSHILRLLLPFSKPSMRAVRAVLIRIASALDTISEMDSSCALVIFNSSSG